jgi:hypothetical protein
MIMCALDFCRALNERGWLAKLLFRLAVGKYAYREYEFLEASLNKQGFDTKLSYGCEDMEYHKLTMKQIIEDWDKPK